MGARIDNRTYSLQSAKLENKSDGTFLTATFAPHNFITAKDYIENEFFTDDSPKAELVYGKKFLYY